MLPPAIKEENVNKVLEWLNEDHSKYPLVGQRAMDAAVALEVSFAEVNIANRRIKFGLVVLQEVKVKKLAKELVPKLVKEKELVPDSVKSPK